MNKKYEFGHQTSKQKAILIGVKGIVLLLLAQTLYSLGWYHETLQGKIGAIGGIFIWIWIYTILMRAKIDIEELFVPPFVDLKGVEFLVLGAIFSTTDQVWTIWNIIQLS